MRQVVIAQKKGGSQSEPDRSNRDGVSSQEIV